MAAKEGQDQFALKIHSLTDREYGYFIDIGCGDCENGNNSIELEKRGWDGILIDQLPTNDGGRDCEVFIKNVIELNWKAFLSQTQTPLLIDYISLDVDNANSSVIQKWPYDYKFISMTFETDKYNCGDSRKKHLLNFLDNNPEYIILFEDVKVQNLEFEDWVVNTKYLPFDCQLGKSLDWQECLSILEDN
jgi:hypothetical protein